MVNTIKTFSAAYGRGHRPSRAFFVCCLLVTGLFYLTAASNTANAATYYVDKNHPSASDANPGTEEALPWKTLTKAATTAQAGDTVLVKAGTYNESLAPINSGTSGAMITFQAYPGHNVVIDGQGLGAICGVDLSYGGGRKYIHVEGFEVRNWGWSGGRTGTAEDVEIVNCDVHDNSYGIGLQGSNVLIENSEIHNNSGGGIGCRADNVLIENNHIHNNTGNGISAGMTGDPAINITIRGNRIHNNYDDAMKPVLEQSIIENNVFGPGADLFSGAHSDGIQIEHMTDTIIRNNIIYDYTQLIYISLYEPVGRFENVDIYGNVFYSNLYYTLGGGEAPAIFITSNQALAGRYVNNINIHSNTFLWVGYAAVWIFEFAGYHPVTNITIRNNIFFDAGIGIDIQNNSEVDSDYNLFYGVSPWIGEGSNSTVGQDPQFVNYERFVSWDVNLQPTSPAIDAGDPALASVFNLPTPFLDIDGTARPQGSGYDIGAYEYISGPPDTTPPLPPTNLINTAQTENSISLSWTAPGPASDGDLASRYRIYRDGTLVGTVTNTSFQDTDLTAETSYSYEVYSVDDAGNQSTSAATGSFATTADTTSPSVLLVSASESSVVIVFSEPVTSLSAEDINNYSINNGISITAASLDTDTVTLTTSAHVEGTYALTVANVQDTSGNQITETTTNYEYDDGLVSHWKFDDGSGSSAVDSSGNSNTGTLINGPTWTTGKIDGGLSFDGVDDAVQIGTGDLNVSAGTIALWTYAESFSSAHHFLFSHATQPWSNRIQLYTDDIEGYLDLGLGDSHTRHTNIQDLNTNTWYHIALTWSGTNYVVYVDSVGKASGTYTGLSTLETYADIGNNGYSSSRSEAFSGIIDEVRIYNRALTAGEILDLYNEGTTPDTTSPVISDLQSSDITVSGATITWNTDEDSTSQVEYGLDTSYGNTTALDATLVTSHSVLLTGLASETLYHYRVRSRDASGNESTGQDNTFTTSGATTYSITASAGAGGAISPSGTTQVGSGGAQTYTITPNTGYHIADVLVDGSSVGAVSSYSFTNVTANHTIAATFAVNTYTITSSAGSGGQISPTGTTQVTYGGSQTYTITPNTGYQIADVVVDGSSVGAVSSYSFTNVTANHTIAATFAINTYSITASAGSGGQISPGGTTQVNWGSTQSYTITSNTGYHIADVVVDGSSVGAVGSYSFTNVTANHTIVASFAVDDQDTTPPTVTNLSPEANAIQVPLNNLIILHIVDAGDGVDANFVTITVNGDVVYAGNTAHYNGPYGDCHRTGTKADYTYIYQANAMFDFDQTVNVTVDAKDLAGNELSGYTYSFNTEMRSFGSNSEVSSTNLSDGAPVTVADSSGNIWAAWHAGPAGSRDIYVGRLAAGAASFGSSLQLTGDVADQYNAAIAVDADDKLYVVWQDNRRGNWDIFISTSVDGINWSTERRVTDSNDNQINPAIVVDGSSPENVYIVWQDDRGGNQDIYIASSSNDFLTETLSQITSDSADQTEPAIAADSDNTIYVVWTDARNSSNDIYGAASNNGPWTNVAIVSNANNQSSPAIATEAVGSILHLLWVDDTSGDQDIYYAASNGLPGSPLSGSSIIDDTSGSNQSKPVIVVTGSTGDSLRVFACWQDTRDSDIDLYFDEITSSSGTDVFVGDDSTNADQADPAIGIDEYGHPYLVWTDSRNTNTDIYYAGSTFTGVDVLAAGIVSSSTGATVGTDPSAISGVDDVSVVVPAGAYSRDIEITISRVTNPLRSGVEYLSLPYEFGPSGIEFDQPVTITIPYEVPASGYSISAYWYNVLTGAPSQQGITDVETIVISSTLHALRFKTTHFTQFFVGGSSGGSTGSGGGGGGGCSISAAGEGSIVESLLPYIGLAVVMVVIKCRDVRNRKSRNITKGEY